MRADRAKVLRLLRTAAGQIEGVIKMVEEGVKETGRDYVVIESRRDAIKYAIDNARENDVIILAGKGHETYQILNTGTIHFDEREVVREILGMEE